MGHTYGIRWNEDLIKEKVLEVKNALKIDRMPSKKECDLYYHNYALSNAITKRMGWYSLAKMLGLEIKRSETKVGKEYEKYIFDILQAKGYSVLQMPQNFPYDLLVNECIKIDVKASRLFKGAAGNFYTFNLEKPYTTCDIYTLVTINDNDNVNSVMIVPSKCVYKNTQISVGEITSKYKKYENRWDYIDDMANYWRKVE